MSTARNDARLFLMLPSSLKKQLEDLSRETGAPVSEIVRRMILEGLAKIHLEELA